jgi:hypothetical protein
MKTTYSRNHQGISRLVPGMFLWILMFAMPFGQAAARTFAGGAITGVMAPQQDPKTLTADGNRTLPDPVLRMPPTSLNPKGISVLQAYPNPASGPVIFEFAVDADIRVIMDLYNTTGARVANLFNADVRAGMNQKVTFSDTLPDGLYIYILRYGTEKMTGKLVVKR